MSVEYAPFTFQERVADLILSGRNVILQAPTGAGKTYAALLPFLRAHEQGLDFPSRCIYAVPMRVLANQFLDKYQEQVAGVSIQTGDRPEDPTLGGRLVFATIDQVLSSFLLMPYGLSHRQANVNAGAVLSSYLVLDEFHLFDPISMLPTALEMLRMLRGITPFCLMTATFSTDLLQGLADYLGATVVPQSRQELDAIHSLQSQQKHRYYHVAAEPLSAERVLEEHYTHHGRTLVICNVVDRAQTLYLEIKRLTQGSGTRVMLLHSRFLKRDRATSERTLREAYSRDSSGPRDIISVATQVVEVGLDITCNSLHTELAPANAIVQRAGRCARYSDEVGHVYVYSSTLGPDGVVDLVERHLPYRGLHKECAATVGAFHELEGREATYAEEQQAVTAVHGPRDRELILGLGAQRESHRHRMNSAMRGEVASAAELVRQVSSRGVVITRTPDELLEAPFACEAFGLHSGTVMGLVRNWLDRAEELPIEGYAVWALHSVTLEEDAARDEYRWIPVASSDDVVGASLIAVHPALATYDAELGFQPHRGGEFVTTPPPPTAGELLGRYGYSLERFADHTERTLAALRSQWMDSAYAARRIEERYGWSPGSIRRVAEVVATVHDVGKLSREWQDWVRRYQEAIGEPLKRGALAHTHYDPDNPVHLAAGRACGVRPPHAAEGAVAALFVLDIAAAHETRLAKAAFTAIARHHAPHTERFSAYHLATRDPLAFMGPESKQILALGKPCVWKLDADPSNLEEDITGVLADPIYDAEWLPYIILVRALRLADQEATSLVSHIADTQSGKEQEM